MRREVLIVDGYNMIGAWPELVKLKGQDDIEG
ncbi:NYN domain-containing protein, partial [Streptococcus pasteurianus]